MMIVDYENVPMTNRGVPVRVVMRFRSLPPLVPMLMMLVVDVQVLMDGGLMIVREGLPILSWP
tara:strand:+ start:6020 stop:6208 length:189 start_codon:yes stop_codon:yes gene_type:complete